MLTVLSVEETVERDVLSVLSEGMTVSVSTVVIEDTLPSKSAVKAKLLTEVSTMVIEVMEVLS